jgi:LuxR family maltose regulon positive regulatory protein
MSSPALIEAQKRALAAKLSLPHQGFVLSRPRLLRRVQPLGGGGVISVVAGPGYGKTAFIVDLLSSTKIRTVYYAVDEGDRDPVRFLTYLGEGLRVQPGGGGPGSSSDWDEPAQVGRTAFDSAAELVETIHREARCPTLLAVDDCHLIDSSPDIARALELITRSLPPGWTVLLSSRRPLAVELDAVSLGGRLLRLQGRDLRLTPREVAAWARQNWDVTLELSEARALWRLTEGWPAALVLVGQHLLSRKTRVDHRAVKGIMARGRELRAYLEQHVISSLEPDVAQTILAASLLPRVVFPRDEELLPGEPGRAESILEEFVAHGFLVTGTGRRSFTIHPLLRGLAMREQWSREGQTGLIRRTAQHLERNGEDREAAYLYLRAGYFESAARPVRSLAVASLNAMVDFARDEWHDLIPDTIVQDEPWLLVAKAKVLQQQAGYAEAAALYERAARLLSGTDDREGLLSVLLASAFCLFNIGDWEESLAVLNRCRSLATCAQEKTEVLVSEGSVLVSLCRWDEAVEDWEKALAVAPAEMRPSLVPRIQMHRGRLFYSLGHYRVGKQWLRRSLDSCSERVSSARALFLNGAALLETATGEYGPAGAHVAECLRLVQARGYSFIHTSALLTQAGVMLATGDFRPGLANIREARSLATAAGDAEELFWVEDMLGDFCRRQRNPRKAQEHHRKALDIAEENRLSFVERVRASTAIGIDQVALGDEAQGRASLEENVSLCRRWGLDGSLVPALFYLGWLNARCGREHEAARSLSEAVRLAAEHEHIHFFVQEARLAVPILALCDRFGVGSFVRERVLPMVPAGLQAHFRLLAEGSTYPTDVTLGPPRLARTGQVFHPLDGEQVGMEDVAGVVGDADVSGIESLTDREREVLKMIALGMPNKVIGAKLFITEKTVKTHANHVFRKLGVSSRVQATLVFQSYQRARRRQGVTR